MSRFPGEHSQCYHLFTVSMLHDIFWGTDNRVYELYQFFRVKESAVNVRVPQDWFILNHSVSVLPILLQKGIVVINISLWFIPKLHTSVFIKSTFVQLTKSSELCLLWRCFTDNNLNNTVSATDALYYHSVGRYIDQKFSNLDIFNS